MFYSVCVSPFLFTKEHDTDTSEAGFQNGN